MQSLLQTQAWADLKAKQGWQVHQIQLPTSERIIHVLEKPLPFGQSFLYAPEASLPDESFTQLDQLTQVVKSLSETAIFFRLEVFQPLGELGMNQSSVAALTQAKFEKAFEEVQPEHRQWVDISHDETTILASMKEKGRYNIRLAEKKGITTRISTDIKDVEVFYQIFQTTAVRDGFRIRNHQYFIDLCQMLFAHNYGELVIAEYQGQPLSALIITYFDGLASYLYGASSNEYRNLMAPYAAHWAAIKSAKKHNCTTYDLLQIAPPNASENHKYTNLTRFKERFGGERVELVGNWDYIFQPAWYRLFKLAETIRRH